MSNGFIIIKLNTYFDFFFQIFKFPAIKIIVCIK